MTTPAKPGGGKYIKIGRTVIGVLRRTHSAYTDWILNDGGRYPPGDVRMVKYLCQALLDGIWDAALLTLQQFCRRSNLRSMQRCGERTEDFGLFSPRLHSGLYQWPSTAKI